MGKRLRLQRRGKGSSRFRASMKPLHRSGYISLNDAQVNGAIKGQVVELLHDTGKTSALMQVLFEDNREEVVVAPEGVFTGQGLEYGAKAAVSVGNAMVLKSIPEGCPVFNIELAPGDGGKIARSSGTYALLVSKEKDKVYVKLSSGQSVTFNPLCRATIGMASGGGRTEKPIVKAGNMFWKMKALGRPYPTVRGVAMNPVSHPFGGSQHHAGKSKSTSRHAPAGRKVGAIASKRTGRRKKN